MGGKFWGELNRVQKNKEKEKMTFIKKVAQIFALLQHSTNSLCKTSADCCIVGVACFSTTDHISPEM